MAAVTTWARVLRAILVPMLFLASGSALQAGEQRYDYDPLGRLVRSVAGGQANEYVYDPAGNLLLVTSGVAQPPTISTGDLGDFRRNEFRHIALGGSNLSGATIRSSHQGISLDNVAISATAINFRVAVSPVTPLGAHELAFETAAGSTVVAMNVVPGLAVTIEPQPIAIPPDSQARKFTVRLSEPASQSVSYSLGTLTPAIARTSNAQVNFVAGQTVADIGVIGMAAGTTVLRVSDPGMVEAAEAAVWVRAGAGSQVNYSAPVGITRGVPWAVSPQTQSYSRSIGITRGVPWADVPERSTMSKAVGIVRGATWLDAQEKFVASKPVGIMRSVPFAKSPDTLVVSPPVGISKP